MHSQPGTIPAICITSNVIILSMRKTPSRLPKHWEKIFHCRMLLPVISILQLDDILHEPLIRAQQRGEQKILQIAKSLLQRLSFRDPHDNPSLASMPTAGAFFNEILQKAQSAADPVFTDHRSLRASCSSRM